MRFIGNKERLLDKLFYAIECEHISGLSFFDLFSGTSSVGKFFKRKNYQVYSSDIMYMSYCLQRAYLENNTIPDFSGSLEEINIASKSIMGTPLDKILHSLNLIDPIEGFVYKNYSIGGTKKLEKPRMYFSDQNAKKIDAIRQQIEKWKANELLTDNEYYILLACLIESIGFYSNVTGVYSAFYKKWDPRALKNFKIRAIEFIIGKYAGKSYNQNSLALVDNIDVDILYLDPPYNERQYAPNYHILETIARYDNPVIHGITGMRNNTDQKSSFCNKKTALRDLEIIAKNARYKYLLLSYNDEGIMDGKDIIQVLTQFGKVKVVEFDYLRFKSNNNGESAHKKRVKERLYMLESNFLS
jgi:adenine-specific DNA-methyltransferase